MYDFQTTADAVSRWTGLGVTLPDDLTAAITVFEALRYTEVGYQPVFDVESVTAKNAEDKIRAFADQLVLAEASGDGYSSVLDRAKKAAVEAAARVVIGHGRIAIPEVISELTPEFERHADAYIAAVSKLPDHLTAESLVAAGPDAVVAYGEAQQEGGYLNRISSWVASTGRLTGGDADVVLRILRPADAAELGKLDAAREKPANSTVQAVDPVFFAAAKLDVEFSIKTLPEAAQLRLQLTTPISTAKAW